MIAKRIAAACVAATLAGAGLSPAAAETIATPALNMMIDGMPNTEANVVVFDVDPGWRTERHHHPGHLFVYVMEGTLRVEVDGQEPRVYSAGAAFHETPDVSMVGSNASTNERAKFVVFQFGEPGQPIMVND